MLIAALAVPLAVPARAQDEACPGGTTIALPNGVTGCVHGPDPEPVGVAPAAAGGLRFQEDTATPTVECVDDGTSGNRVQALYVVASDRPNRSGEVVPLIRSAIEDVDQIFHDSSDSGDSHLAVRWVHDADCVAVVRTVVVPPWADDSFAATIDALADAGYDEPGRHYLSWVDAERYCGIAVAFGDDRPGQENVNNGAYPLWGRVDRNCWGRDGLVEAHELTHMLGAVQGSAPHATDRGHCTDDHDVMCYADGPGVHMSSACPDPSSELLLDCNRDDYFNRAPAPGSYLDTHWNVARSSFLTVGQEPQSPLEPRREPPSAERSMFTDVASSNPFGADIDWLRNSGITLGCNPPANDRFCPEATVSRGQMAAFLVRGLGLETAGGDLFTDDDGTPFETDIEKLAVAGITAGCTTDRFCPESPVTRGQMAAFLARALDLPTVAGDRFGDDDASPFQTDIERLAAAGITTGCTADRFCPDNPITRGQMAAFLRRALD